MITAIFDKAMKLSGRAKAGGQAVLDLPPPYVKAGSEEEKKWYQKVLKKKQKKDKEKGRKKKDESQAHEEEAPKPDGDKTFLRYYHLYRKGELEGDIEQAGGVVLESGYEKDNWWAIARLR